MAVRSSKKRQKGVAAETVAPGVVEMKVGMLQMESFLQEAAALAAAEVRRVEEIRRVLGEKVGRLEAEAEEKREMLRERSAAQEGLETKLAAQVRELEDQLAKKEKLLESRALELQDSQAKSQDTRTAVLQAQVKEQQETLGQKETALRELQESTAARIRDLEGQIRKGAELLENRAAEIAELRAKLDTLRLSQEGSVSLTEDNVVLLDEPAQGPETEPPPGSGAAKSKVIGQSRREIMARPGKTVRREAAPEPKKSRLATLLAPVKKGN